MDLIYMNASHEDIGVLHDYRLDLAYGEDENDFELQIPSSAHCCGKGFFVYMDGTEYGGIVDEIASDTDAEEVTYTGRTWHRISAVGPISATISSQLFQATTQASTSIFSNPFSSMNSSSAVDARVPIPTLKP